MTRKRHRMSDEQEAAEVAAAAASALEPPLMRMVSETLEPIQGLLWLEPGVQALAPQLPSID